MRTLVAHLVAVLRKLTVVAGGGDMCAVPDPADDPYAGEGRTFRLARADLDRAWSADATLGDGYALPWGGMSGRQLLDAYVGRVA